MNMITRNSADCQDKNDPTKGDIIASAEGPIEDWQRQLSRSNISVVSLLKQLDLYDNAPGTDFEHQKNFPLRVPDAYIKRMRKGDINDPLLKQVLPSQQEWDAIPGFTHDPLQEAQYNPTPGLIHKYHGRALLIVTQACAVHCRYCFRRHFDYQENLLGPKQWQPTFDYLDSHPELTEVILSGGDPLAASDKHLAWLSQQIGSIPHVSRLRIHSRLPIVLPQRINQPLLDWLSAWPGQTVMVVHCNHANEINDEVKHAVQKLSSAGVTVLNQTVLLAGINDNVSALAELSESLFDAKIMPYYLHTLDAVSGAGHFSVSDHRARRLIGELSRRLSGFLVPKLVREHPHAHSKTPLQAIF